MTIVCMVPARLGSKRVKNKNLRLLDGKPMVSHVLAKARAAGVFADIYVNSEAEIFVPLCARYGVKFYKRPMALASDTATNDQFVQDFIDHVPCDIIVQINPTSPLLTVEDIRAFVRLMVEGGYDTLHAVKKEQIEGIYKGNPLNFDPSRPMPRSQDLEPVYLFSSGIMAWRSSGHTDNMRTLGCATYGGKGKIGYFTLSGFSTIDIDHEEDFVLAELAMAFEKKSKQEGPLFYA